jgi:hypothetical protein
MSVSKETIRINITMPEKFHERVKAYAEKNQRSVSAQIRYVLEQAMKGEEQAC